MFTQQRGSIKGELGQLRDQIRRYENELSTDYKDIDGIYAELYISVKTTELASNDLQTYSKVLETAIMKYHSLKMDDLNKIIKDLWYKTYKGGGNKSKLGHILLLNTLFRYRLHCCSRRQ